MDNMTLYLVYFMTKVGPIEDGPELVELGPGLFLTESFRSRSELYDLLKRRFEPTCLLVAQLQEDPKFMGMAPGVQAWLRVRSSG